MFRLFLLLIIMREPLRHKIPDLKIAKETYYYYNYHYHYHHYYCHCHHIVIVIIIVIIITCMYHYHYYYSRFNAWGTSSFASTSIVTHYNILFPFRMSSLTKQQKGRSFLLPSNVQVRVVTGLVN